MKNVFTCIVLLFICTFFANRVQANDIVRNNTLWNNVLHRHLKVGEELDGITLNTLNYSAVNEDDEFHEYVKALKDADTSNLTRDEFYGFFSNVYNALIVNMVLEHPCHKDIFGSCGPIKSIRDIGNFPFTQVWNKKAGTVGGKEYTLQEIEDLMRTPTNGGYKFAEDPRLHACIVCASISCPNLATYAYDASPSIDAQFTQSFNDFLGNSRKGMSVDKSNKRVTLSKIFDWYSGDFKKAGNGTVVGFILKYLDPENPNYDWLSSTDPSSIDLVYFDYNWDLNKTPGSSVPCDSSSRPCYTTLWLLVTIGSLLIVALVAGLVYRCCRRRRHVPAYEELKY